MKVYPNATPATPFRGATVHYVVAGIFSRDSGLRGAELEFYLQGGPVTQGHFVDERVLFNIELHAQ